MKLTRRKFLERPTSIILGEKSFHFHSPFGVIDRAVLLTAEVGFNLGGGVSELFHLIGC